MKFSFTNGLLIHLDFWFRFHDWPEFWCLTYRNKYKPMPRHQLHDPKKTDPFNGGVSIPNCSWPVIPTALSLSPIEMACLFYTKSNEIQSFFTCFRWLRRPLVLGRLFELLQRINYINGWNYGRRRRQAIIKFSRRWRSG